MAKKLSFVLVLAIFAGMAWGVNVSVDFSTGIGTINLAYGANEVDAYDKFRAGYADIVNNHKEINTKYVRIFAQIDLPWYFIESGVNVTYQIGAKPFICIQYVPSGWDWDYFAQRCGALVSYMKSKYGDLSDWYWEIINEPNLFGGFTASSYVTLYNMCEAQMHAADPTTNIGGPGCAWFDTPWIQAMLSSANRMDFLSWHRYGIYADPNDVTDEQLMDATPQFGADVNQAKYYLDYYNRPGLKLIMGEYNANSYYAPTDPRIKQIFNTAWVGSTLRHLMWTSTGNSADMALIWEGTGGDANYGFGVWGDYGTPRAPVFYGLKLITTYFRKGAQVVSTSDDDPKVDVLAVRYLDENEFALMLINKENVTKDVTLNVTGLGSCQGIWYTADQYAYDHEGGISEELVPIEPTMQTQLNGYCVKVLYVAQPDEITITHASAETTQTTATITWRTNILATSQVEYGLTTDYGNMTPLDENLVVVHSVTITGLEPATTYHYRVRSSAPGVPEAVSQDYTFTTKGFTYTSPAGRFVAGWNLFSLPAEPQEPEAYNVLQDAVDAGNTLENNLYEYSPRYGYRVYPQDFLYLYSGYGYWLLLTNACDISYTGVPYSVDQQVYLMNGWNLIGLPFDTPVLWGSCRVNDGNEELSIQDAAAAGWIQESLYTYENDEYIMVTPDDYMQPWYGYWILALKAGLTLIIPAP